jgi:hypothetical protein
MLIQEMQDTIKEEEDLSDKEDIMTRYVEISQLQGGQSCGDLALIEQKPRMASIRCL